MKTCPHCGEKIQESARKCKFCMEFVNTTNFPKKNISAIKNISYVLIFLLLAYIVFTIFTFLFSASGIIDPELLIVEETIEGIEILFRVIILVFIFIWSYKNYKHLYNLGERDLTHTPTWSIWGWIIPIVNLWFPYQIVKDMFSSNYKLSELKNEKEKNNWTNKIGWRWGLWISCLILIQIWPERDESAFILLPIAGFIIAHFLFIQIIIKNLSIQEGK